MEVMEFFFSPPRRFTFQFCLILYERTLNKSLTDEKERREMEGGRLGKCPLTEVPLFPPTLTCIPVGGRTRIMAVLEVPACRSPTKWVRR